MSTRAFRSNSRAIKAADGNSNNYDFSPTNIITCTSAGLSMLGCRTCHNAWWYGGYSRTAFGGDFGQGLEEQAVPGHSKQNSGHREHWTQKAGETNRINSKQLQSLISLKPQWILKGWVLFCHPTHCRVSYLVDRAQSEPTATTYLAGPQPMCSKATGRGLFSLSR